VLFDLGGVVFPSPFDLFASYERAHGLPDRFIRNVVAASTDHGAWARLERSDITFDEFCDAFAAECADAGGTVDPPELMAAMGRGFDARPEMLAAIKSIKANRLRVGALTNNWAPTSAAPGVGEKRLGDLFDVVVESAVEGLRKPDPKIYVLACARLEVEPADVVFLDDLGVNLKPARAMGMTTIKVDDPNVALDELRAALGFALGGR
jgi:putative hydrolase of the HAD superfamily